MILALDTVDNLRDFSVSRRLSYLSEFVLICVLNMSMSCGCTNGEMLIKYLYIYLPDDSPKIVMDSGSPPNTAMLSFVHCMARRWSQRP
jgi:hypothetical protein